MVLLQFYCSFTDCQCQYYYNKSAVARFARNNILVAQYRNLNRWNDIGSIHQKASTACNYTMFPSTGHIIDPGSKGMEGLPCDLTTQSCPQHHRTNCDSLLLLLVSSKTLIA